MRHLLGNIALWTIAGLLLAGAFLFGWIRSAQVAVSDEKTVLAGYEPAPAHEFQWKELGEISYVKNCQNCHGRNGQGWDQYPGLGHTAQLFAAPGGRDYLVDVHLYGLTSDRWRAPMPPMGHMSDVALAAAMNSVLTRFGNERHLPPEARLYTPAEVAARRGADLTPAQVNRQRPTLAD